MQPGPTYIHSCPNCGNLLWRGSLLSGNTFGAKIYSDGKRIARMLPDFPKISKCKKCNTIFWFSRKNIIGEQLWNSDPKPEWKNADKAEFLNIEDCFTALENRIFKTKSEEFSIRQQIWWAYNDRIRNGQPIFNDESDERKWLNNIKELKLLLNPSDINQLIMMAEVDRNLGDFENCITLINGITNNDLDWIKELFLQECTKMNRWVFELQHDTHN